ncbi:MAG: hypothetical protein IPI32_13890 [Austwickia sp.]|nr:hypothetical protein [Austwickia sp.]
MFLHPSQARAALADCPGLQSWRLLVDRVDHRDELTCEVVAAEGVAAADLIELVGRRIRDRLRFAAAVTLVDAIPEGGATLTDRRTWD